MVFLILLLFTSSVLDLYLPAVYSLIFYGPLKKKNHAIVREVILMLKSVLFVILYRYHTSTRNFIVPTKECINLIPCMLSLAQFEFSLFK